MLFPIPPIYSIPTTALTNTAVGNRNVEDKDPDLVDPTYENYHKKELDKEEDKDLGIDLNDVDDFHLLR